jgi:hypothetical protein
MDFIAPLIYDLGTGTNLSKLSDAQKRHFDFWIKYVVVQAARQKTGDR